MTGRWRYFRTGDLAADLAHADAGGVAVHDAGKKFMGKDAAHLFAGTRMALMTAAEEVGVDARHLQMHGDRPHFDVFGGPLIHALEKCLADEEGGEDHDA